MSQVIPDDIVDRVNKSEFIFEGEVILSNSYWNARHDFIYTSITISTQRLFKGSLTCGTVELILLGGRIGEEYMEFDHNLILNQGSKGIFLCVRTDREQSVVDFYQESNSVKLEPIFNEQGYIEFNSDGIGQDVIDYWQFQLPDLAQAYNLMELYTQLNYIDCTPIPMLQTVVVDTSLTVTLEHPVITTHNGIKSFAFDVSLSDSINNIYFYAAILKIKYDTLTFGDNVFNSGKIFVSNGTLLLDTVTFHPVSGDDDVPGVFRLYTHNHLYSNPFHLPYNFPALSTTPIDAIHVVIEIKDCNHSGVIQPIVTNGGVHLQQYFLFPDSLSNFPPVYDTIYAANSITFNGCGTKYITSILPNTVNAGVGDTVIISGQGFDTIPGKVFLKNANNGGASYIYLDTMDYLPNGWSNTEIKFIVPSVTDSIGRRKVPGSGTVKIKTISGDSINDLSDSLFIYYGVANTRETDTTGGYHVVKSLNRLAPWNYGGVSNAFLFRTDPNFSNHLDWMTCLDAAIKQWVCLTTVNFKLGTDTILPYDTSYASNDSVSFIKVWQFPAADSMTIARTTQIGVIKFNSCNSDFVTEIDMRINSKYITSFVADTNQIHSIVAGKIDLYQILLHELGHGHSLTHVNDPHAIMWWRGDNPIGILAADRRIKLWEQYSATDAGQYVVSNSYTFDSVNCTGISRMTSGSTNCMLIGVSELNKPDINLITYPNPTKNKITVSYTTDKSNIVTINLFDITGRVVYCERSVEFGGSHLNTINLESFFGGFYFMRIAIGKNIYISKIIKQ